MQVTLGFIVNQEKTDLTASIEAYIVPDIPHFDQQHEIAYLEAKGEVNFDLNHLEWRNDIYFK